MSLISCEIPLTFYNINKNNNKLHITENAIARDIIISYGNYNITQLRSELQNQFGPNYNITYNSISNKLSIQLLANITTIIDINNSTIGNVIGYIINHTIILNQTITSDTVCNMTYTLSLYYTVDIVDEETLLSQTGKTNNIIQKIPINSPQNTILIFYPTQAKHIVFCANNIRTITINLFDDRMREIDLNGQYFISTLLVQFIQYDNVNIEDIESDLLRY
jgi:hypothetical protein